ncbi:hypothetical protein [Paenibacillus ferrarius]|nr:hypothetical protein [Paenibacillus ferrarius]
MAQTLIREILEIMKNGREPYLTDDGWVEFWRIALEEEQNADLSA